jgi:hypothetical protein
MNNFKKQGVYVRGGIQGDNALQRKMCTEIKRVIIEARSHRALTVMVSET